MERNKYEAVVIGTSAGGLTALKTIIMKIENKNIPPVIIVQHMHPQSDDFLACYLNNITHLTVKQADEKEKILPNTIYLSPANYHLLIEEDRTFSLSIDKHENYSRPSIDVLFDTAAEVYCPDIIGIILTGANNDGANGIKKIKEHGGLTIVQDPLTAEADAMPKAALSATHIDKILTLEQIGHFLNKINIK
jgi:two-component system chemotaxis response regulator CheB